MDRDTVYLALPHRDDFSASTLWGVLFAGKRAKVVPRHASNSILTLCFNTLWTEALNWRKEYGLTLFSMLHSDVGPEMGFMDTLVDEYHKCGADVLSVVVPLKDSRGLTSTALRNPKTGHMKRLSMREVFDFPVTFDAAAIGYPDRTLLLNTGLWICDFTKPWVEEVFFRQLDGIVKGPDGKFFPSSMSEDWLFSMDVQQLGLKVMATRAVKVDHQGVGVFSNDVPWGLWDKDREDGDLSVKEEELRTHPGTVAATLR